MSSNKSKYQLKIPSKSDNLELIRSFVSRISEKVGFDSDDANKIELAVDEACANVIKHAYSEENKKSINLVIEIDYKKLSILISDHGKGFSVAKIANTDMKEYLAEMRVGGLGIHLMKALMDEVEFNSDPDKKTQVKMVKYFIKDGQLEKKK